MCIKIRDTQRLMVDNMGSLVLHFTLLTLLFPYPSNSDDTTPFASLQEHVKKLDEMLAEMKSHSKAQEQKNSAVLSSVLSQLTQTTDELGDMKTSHNKTIQKLEMKDEELSELWASHNATNLKLKEKDAELSQLWESYNATVLELQELMAKHNNVVVECEETKAKLDEWELRPKLNGYIGFHVGLSKEKQVIANTPIHFDSILYDTGPAYDKSTGKFLVPMNGTYLVWIDLAYKRPTYDVGFYIKTGKKTIAEVYGSKSERTETTSTIGMHYLQQGESVWVSPGQNVTPVGFFCNFGAVLLNTH